MGKGDNIDFQTFVENVFFLHAKNISDRYGKPSQKARAFSIAFRLSVHF